MKTGFAAMRMGWVAYVIPFLFVFSPTLVMQGETADIVLNTSTAILGVYIVSVAMTGYFTRPFSPLMRLLLAAAGAAALVPDSVLGTGGLVDLAGAAIGTAILVRERLAVRRNAA